MKSDKLKAIEEELARQNEALADLERMANAMADVSVCVPPSFFDEIEQLATAKTVAMPLIVGIRV